jgi:gamma-glutamylcyclotransferase (GGCT)/AIG2-like uncharacterized protein YtfP
VERWRDPSARLLALASQALRRQASEASQALAEALALCAQPLPPGATPAELRACLERGLGHPSRRLAAYGTLRPGQPSQEELLADLSGVWRTGGVRGRLDPRGGGLTGGYPALVPDPDAGVVPVHVLESGGLPARWDALDAYEGEAYARTLVPVELEGDGCTLAWLYALAPRLRA